MHCSYFYVVFSFCPSCVQPFVPFPEQRMAAAPPLADAGTMCANCRVYDWPKPEDWSTLKKCGRCKVLWYCGQLCQAEHWAKVHKHHCRLDHKYYVVTKMAKRLKRHRR